MCFNDTSRCTFSESQSCYEHIQCVGSEQNGWIPHENADNIASYRQKIHACPRQKTVVTQFKISLAKTDQAQLNFLKFDASSPKATDAQTLSPMTMQWVNLSVLASMKRSPSLEAHIWVVSHTRNVTKTFGFYQLHRRIGINSNAKRSSSKNVSNISRSPLIGEVRDYQVRLPRTICSFFDFNSGIQDARIFHGMLLETQGIYGGNFNSWDVVRTLRKRL